MFAQLRASFEGKGMDPRDTGFGEHFLWHTGHTEDKGSRYADPVVADNGKLFDVPNDVLEERPLAEDAGGPEAAAARQKLQPFLDQMKV